MQRRLIITTKLLLPKRKTSGDIFASLSGFSFIKIVLKPAIVHDGRHGKN
jgi:hypothetical protein